MVWKGFYWQRYLVLNMLKRRGNNDIWKHLPASGLVGLFKVFMQCCRIYNTSTTMYKCFSLVHAPCELHIILLSSSSPEVPLFFNVCHSFAIHVPFTIMDLQHQKIIWYLIFMECRTHGTACNTHVCCPVTHMKKKISTAQFYHSTPLIMKPLKLVETLFMFLQ